MLPTKTRGNVEQTAATFFPKHIFAHWLIAIEKSSRYFLTILLPESYLVGQSTRTSSNWSKMRRCIWNKQQFSWLSKKVNTNLVLLVIWLCVRTYTRRTDNSCYLRAAVIKDDEFMTTCLLTSCCCCCCYEYASHVRPYWVLACVLWTVGQSEELFQDFDWPVWYKHTYNYLTMPQLIPLCLFFHLVWPSRS